MMHHKDARTVTKVTAVAVDFDHPKNSFHGVDVWGAIGTIFSIKSYVDPFQSQKQGLGCALML